MASPHDNLSMAVFCDFENVALGVRDAKYEKFDIKPVLERLLLKGSIVVKKAYCDWDRYKAFKATMHEANFELIEIPHVRQSGKNSADIRLVVDALDLCYTKSHVNTFVIISGDSDFSPLVSKLRENAKQVIGVGVKQSTSDLLIANCDEFIFYDDLVREIQRTAAKREAREAHPAPKRPPEEEHRRKEELEARKSKAIEMVVETFEALVSERGDSGKIWASMLKEALKRRKPDFSESYYGFRAFGNLLEEAQARGLLEFGRDEKSGAYVYRSIGKAPAADTLREHPVAPVAPLEAVAEPAAGEEAGAKRESRRKGRGGRKPAEKKAEPIAPESQPAHAVTEAPTEVSPQPVPSVPAVEAVAPSEAAPAAGAEQAPEAMQPAPSHKPAQRTRRTRRAQPAQGGKPESAEHAPPQAVQVETAQPQSVPAPPGAEEPAAKPARKPAARSRRPRKTEPAPDHG